MPSLTDKKETKASEPELYFLPFKKQIIGQNLIFSSPNGPKRLIYADWIASGRLYATIEDKLRNRIGPMVANTHSFSSETGKASTYAYTYARKIIKKHVNANEDDLLITAGTGMTTLLSRLQRLMGLRYFRASYDRTKIAERQRPVVFITHMEHHSNQVPWMETIADVVIVPCDKNQLVSPQNLEKELRKYRDRPLKIGAFTACSNVTGIITPYHRLAKTMHAYNGYCIVDFAASAPYVSIDMHPEDAEERLDAVLFSPHKFLGGPGSSGVLVFNKALYKADVPDVPGGGNVKWTDPWGAYGYFGDIETREDGGTPGFLQTMRAAMAIRLKEQMGVKNMEERERELLRRCFEKLRRVEGLKILGDLKSKRIGCVSFCIDTIHYNLVVRLLNDRFGIQVRGGWSCASTYGHYLLNVDRTSSRKIMNGISNKDLSNKPGWVRLSLHPTMSDEELDHICRAIGEIAENISEWKKDYVYDAQTNEFNHVGTNDVKLIEQVRNWFDQADHDQQV